MAMVAMLIGVPGSGKSTWAKGALKEIQGPVRYISTDEIREKRFGDVADMSHNAQVFQAMKQEMIRALQQGESVVLDATFVKRSERRPYILLAKEHGAEVKAYYIKTELTEALQRNANRDRQVPEDVIRLRHNEMEEPEEKEGFSEVIVVG